MKKLIALSLTSLAILGAATIVSADTTNCQPIYGGGSSCEQQGNISINKMVLDPSSDNSKGSSEAYVENLGVSDNRYSADENASFQVILTNTGNKTINSISVKDIFPQFVTFEKATIWDKDTKQEKPLSASFDSNSKTVTVTLDKLEPGEDKQQKLFFRGKIVSSASLPNDTGINCVVNQAFATAENKTSQDNAQLCIQKDVLGATPTTKGGLPVFPPTEVKKTPNTGAEAFALIGLIPSALAGFALRRKTK